MITAVDFHSFLKGLIVMTQVQANSGRQTIINKRNIFIMVYICDFSSTIYSILSRASEAGSPTNRPGSDKTQGQGSFGPSTGGPDLQGSLQPAELNTR